MWNTRYIIQFGIIRVFITFHLFSIHTDKAHGFHLLQYICAFLGKYHKRISLALNRIMFTHTQHTYINTKIFEWEQHEHWNTYHKTQMKRQIFAYYMHTEWVFVYLCGHINFIRLDLYMEGKTFFLLFIFQSVVCIILNWKYSQWFRRYIYMLHVNTGKKRFSSFFGFVFDCLNAFERNMYR